MSFNPVQEVEEELIAELRSARESFLDPDIANSDLPPVEVEVPREDDHGDYATNLALALGGRLNMNPRQVAEGLKEEFSSDLVEKTEIAGPGFINFWLDDRWLYEAADKILELGEDFGRTDFGSGRKVQVEFVSVNPTGPLHVGHSRGAVVGDTTASILSHAGYEVEREYLINDSGNQMELLGRSTFLRYQELFGQEIEMPKNSYRGEYLIEIAEELKEEYGRELLNKPEEEAFEICREFAYDRILKIIRRDLNDFGIEFDNWFSERSLHEEDRIEEVVDYLREQDYIYEEEGALWFASSQFGDDKDRVMIKSDGSPTYMAADIAYHQDKLERGFDKIINVWGADHHGYIDRMKASIEALGHERDKLEIIIVQIVNLLRGGERLPMSKREGEFVTMRELMDEIGLDAARYFFIMRSTNSHFDFDLDLAKKESKDNPVYYIQYSHARICSIIEKADDLCEELSAADWSLLDSEAGLELLRHLVYFPEEVKEAARGRAPHRLANYIYDLANAFHVFYNKCQVLGDDRSKSLIRLKLVEVTRTVLINALNLIGVSAPEQM
ncbi:arginine--tRNA ligase [Halarsenatibacter silvermanii]|uniref:Arginine--tRNA ligase n=1 Tax=Halarsenatibacter silvermanii TaxID=321763 RepID=A0A1G9HZ82_9FIRM|nr:arginine--tRNA ligase [Halarsenatibacter silvermanii]SDL17863.1 arginyl-tRNA synthetase [Halarsenatibacter silvermanii]